MKRRTQVLSAILLVGIVIAGVQYGIIRVPVAEKNEDRASGIEDGASKAGERAIDPPPEGTPAGQLMMSILGSSPLLFRDNVQEELKLTDDQILKLENWRQEQTKEAEKIVKKLEQTKPEEHAQTLEPFKKKTHEKLASLLKASLNAEQVKRFEQLHLQEQGLFALVDVGRPDLQKQLKLTDEQKRKFNGVNKDLVEKNVQIFKEAQAGGNSNSLEIARKIIKNQKEQASKIEALLTDEQKKQWKELLGKPFDFGLGMIEDPQRTQRDAEKKKEN